MDKDIIFFLKKKGVMVKFIQKSQKIGNETP